MYLDTPTADQKPNQNTSYLQLFIPFPATSNTHDCVLIKRIYIAICVYRFLLFYILLDRVILGLQKKR